MHRFPSPASEMPQAAAKVAVSCGVNHTWSFLPFGWTMSGVFGVSSIVSTHVLSKARLLQYFSLPLLSPHSFVTLKKARTDRIHSPFRRPISWRFVFLRLAILD